MGLAFAEDTRQVQDMRKNSSSEINEEVAFEEWSTRSENLIIEIPLKALHWVNDLSNVENFETEQHEGFSNTTSENLSNLSNAGK